MVERLVLVLEVSNEKRLVVLQVLYDLLPEINILVRFMLILFINICVVLGLNV